MNDKEITVSIIMPAYNSGKYIDAAIDSVLKQTFPKWELIVIDDASTDETARIVRNYALKDHRIHYFRMGTNSGVSAARNKGVSIAQGSYVAFLDSDDIWLPDKLKCQLTMAAETGADLIYSSYAIIDGTGKKIRQDYLAPETISIEKLMVENVIGCSTVMLSSSIAREFRFSPEYYHEDYLLWLTILQSGYCAVGCKEVLTCWRCISGSRSFDKGTSARHRWRIYKNALKLPLMDCLRYFVKYAVHGICKYTNK